MPCCTTSGTDKFFTKQARRYAKKFRKKGLDSVQRILAHSLTKLDVRSRSILEIGCGVGGLHQELLKRGAGSAVGVDVSEGMVEQATILAREQTLNDRTRYMVGDFVFLKGELLPADIVILDKVVCCYADPEVLLNKAAGKCRRYLGLSYPRAALIPRAVFKLGSRIGEWLKWSFHPYYHEPSGIEGIIQEGGFEEIYSTNTIVWQVKVWERTKNGGGSERPGIGTLDSKL